jgi:hypothetical protein
LIPAAAIGLANVDPDRPPPSGLPLELAVALELDLLPR